MTIVRTHLLQLPQFTFMSFSQTRRCASLVSEAAIFLVFSARRTPQPSWNTCTDSVDHKGSVSGCEPFGIS